MHPKWHLRKGAPSKSRVRSRRSSPLPDKKEPRTRARTRPRETHRVRVMSLLSHRIKIFVFRMAGPEPHYLLLKPDQGIEALWGPLQGTLGFGDKLEAAVRRRVVEETGLANPSWLIDLEMPEQVVWGDDRIVEWNFGCQSIGDPDPSCLDRFWSAYRWADFAEAYPSLGFEADRAAILRLHARLGAA